MTAAPLGRDIRPEIQSLRAIAVVLVLVYHWWPAALRGGFVGVDVFFVISGYLTTAHLLREAEATGRVSLLGFWARRARRILPAALVVLLFCTLATIAVVPQLHWEPFLTEIRASTLYVENWHLANTAVDYLAADDAPTPVRHFWSLSAEEQFYLLWPVLILVGAAVGSRAIAVAVPGHRRAAARPRRPRRHPGGGDDGSAEAAAGPVPRRHLLLRLPLALAAAGADAVRARPRDDDAGEAAAPGAHDRARLADQGGGRGSGPARVVPRAAAPDLDVRDDGGGHGACARTRVDPRGRAAEDARRGTRSEAREIPEPRRSECVRWRQEVLRWLAAHPEVTRIFVSQSVAGAVATADGASQLDTQVEGYRAEWRRVPPSVKRIFVLRDTPRALPHGATLECVEEAMRDRRRAGRACALPRSQALRADPAAIAAESEPRAVVVDLTRFFCDARRCLAVVGGALVHRDVSHMTTTFATTLGPYLLRALA